MLDCAVTSSVTLGLGGRRPRGQAAHSMGIRAYCVLGVEESGSRTRAGQAARFARWADGMSAFGQLPVGAIQESSNGAARARESRAGVLAAKRS